MQYMLQKFRKYLYALASHPFQQNIISMLHDINNFWTAVCEYLL